MNGKEAKKRLQKKYTNQNGWIKENRDRQTITLPKGTKEAIKERGETVNGLVNRLVLEWLENN